MLLWNRLPQRRGGFLKALSDHDRGDRNAIRVERFESAKSSPLGRDRRIGQKSFEQRLMVAFERDVSGRERIICQTVQHASRIGTSVHVVAQRDGQAIGDRAFFEILLDLLDHFVEQIGATMDVADDVDSLVRSDVSQFFLLPSPGTWYPLHVSDNPPFWSRKILVSQSPPTPDGSPQTRTIWVLFYRMLIRPARSR